MVKPVEKPNTKLNEDVEEYDAENLTQDVEKYEQRFSKLKTVDARAASVDYNFPLLRKFLAVLAVHEARLDAHEEAIESLADDLDLDDEVQDALSAGGAAIARLSDLLDEVVVTAGFYDVVKGEGLRATAKCPPGIRQKYEGIADDVREVVEQIGEALTDLRERQTEDEPDGVPAVRIEPGGGSDTSGLPVSPVTSAARTSEGEGNHA
jgi:hypothetical protein